jgi:hypothetical protein
MKVMFIHYGLDYFVYRSLVVIVNKREHFILIKFLPFAILINHPLSSNFFLLTYNILFFTSLILINFILI